MRLGSPAVWGQSEFWVYLLSCHTEGFKAVDLATISSLLSLLWLSALIPMAWWLSNLTYRLLNQEQRSPGSPVWFQSSKLTKTCGYLWKILKPGHWEILILVFLGKKTKQPKKMRRWPYKWSDTPFNKKGHKSSQQVMLSICEAFTAYSFLFPFNSKGLFSLDSFSPPASLESGSYLLKMQDSLPSRDSSPYSLPLFSQCLGTHFLKTTARTKTSQWAGGWAQSVQTMEWEN